MSKKQLEQHLQRQITREEEVKGSIIVGYDDIVWNKFM
jgi:hypothetical protein